MVPVELRGGDGCDVTVLRRQGNAFVAETAVPGWFVPLLGDGQERIGTALPEMLSGKPAERFALPLGLLGEGGPAPAAAQFRAFLGRTEPGFVARQSGGDWRPWMPLPPFGLTDRVNGSVALWQDGGVVSHGDRTAAIHLARAYARWAALGLPGTGAFCLEVHRAAAAPPGTDRLWVEPRGSTALAWRLRPEIGDWQALADADAVDTRR